MNIIVSIVFLHVSFSSVKVIRRADVMELLLLLPNWSVHCPNMARVVICVWVEDSG